MTLRTLRFIKLYSFPLFIFTGFAGCSKTTDPDPVTTNPIDSASAQVNGSLYIQKLDSLVKVNTTTGALDWGVYNFSVSAGSPLNYDSASLYHGGLSEISSFNANNGHVNWTYFVTAYSDAGNSATYRATDFKDSLCYFTSATSAWHGGGSLYCVNKSTGHLKWQQKIDNNQNGFFEFSAIPYVEDDKVVTVTRDRNGINQVSCFDAENGNMVWESEENNALPVRLKINEHKIFAISASTVYCYDFYSGKLLWQTNLQLPASKMEVYSYFANNNLIITTNEGNSNTVKVLNKLTGSISATKNLNVENVAFGEMLLYNNNTLYSINILLNDSSSITAFDFNTLAIKWKYQAQRINPEVLVMTNKYIIFPVTEVIGDPSLSHVAFLSYNGRLVKTYRTDGSPAAKIVFVENGTVYKVQDY